MASREGQGMQIAVILFAMLTVVLAITTYIFYAESSKLSDQLKAEQEKYASADKGQKSANYRLTALMYTMGMKTLPDVEAAKTQAGGTADAEVEKWLTDYRTDMKLIGDDEKNPKENYRTLVNRLLLTINQKNDTVTTTNATLVSTQQQKDQQIADATTAKQTAETNLKAAQDDYANARQQLQDQLNQKTKEMNDLVVKFDADLKAEKTRGDDLQNKLNKLIEDYRLAQQQISALRADRDRLAQDQGANLDNPDGQIIWVNQRQRLVWINLGSADYLNRQMTFSVYSKEQASSFMLRTRPKLDGTGTERAAVLQSKGRIEVVRILGPNQAECRILEDSPSDPIVPGDWIQTPAWAPGQQLHFAIVGFVDLDGDRQSDRDLLHNLITINGGVIDAELTESGERIGAITVKTRYYVVAKQPEDKGYAIAFRDASAYQSQLNSMDSDRDRFGVQMISLEQLLERMGWKPEEKTVGLGGTSDVGPTGFRRRTPPGEKAAAPMPMPAPAATPSTTPPAAEPTDPFGAKP
jgi:hypothetical protein